MYSKRPFGIFFSASCSLITSGNLCGHTALNLSDFRMPSHGEGVLVGPKL